MRDERGWPLRLFSRQPLARPLHAALAHPLVQTRLLALPRFGNRPKGCLRVGINLLGMGRTSAETGLPSPRHGIGELRTPRGDAGRRLRLPFARQVELRGRSRVIDAGHLPGELTQIARGLGRDKQMDI